MMPALRLNTSPVTTSQPPHSMIAARVRSVRGARSRQASPATSTRSTAGSSHDACPPITSFNKRRTPVVPLKFPPPPPPPPTPLPLPVRRPNPLYPTIRLRMLLLDEPSIIGRDAAGHSATIATHQPALASSAAP